MNAFENAIQIRGLRKSYPTFQLGPLDLDVPRGSIIGLVGPNGSGKSTTIDMMFGMGLPDAGSIRLLGMDSARDEVAIKLRTAYVGPDLDYVSWKTVANAIRFVRGFYPKSWDDHQCARLLDSFQLDPAEKIATLSFGSKTKLALVIALARHPELLILDEPTTGLDTIVKRELFAALLDLVKDSDHTILISSHNLSDIERFADQVAIINNGMLLHAGPMDAVVEQFCIADFTLPADPGLSGTLGVKLMFRQGNRCRALIDSDLNGLERLATLGASDITHSTVNLEELFIALLKK